MTLAVPDILVSTAWLAENLAHPDLRILDCSVTLVPVDGGVRPESGRGAWAGEHIPGSGFADLLADLSDTSQPLPIMTPRVRLINALSAEEHSGKVSRTARPGRIPGSGNVPAGSLLDPVTGAYLPLPVLRERFAAQGALDGRSVVTYCGGGIAATSAAFTLVRLGVQDVAVYDGSLVEWSQEASLPMEVG